MGKKQEIYDAAAYIRERRASWYESIASDAGFQARGGKVYPYDITGSNLDPLFSLFASTGMESQLEDGRVRSLCDIGCANGELSFAFSRAGFDVTAVDYSFAHDQAPYMVSAIAAKESMNVAVVDRSVDNYFDFQDLVDSRVNPGRGEMPADGVFDLAICVGLLYHLRNPFAFMESLAKMCRHAVVGTHIFTHTPQLQTCVSSVPVAYLVEANELNHDPTNFWILSEKAFARLARRSGFEVVDTLMIPNNALGVAVPDRPDLGIRNFLMLKSTVHG